MRLEDITVEVRDKSLARRGLVRPEELQLEATDNFNGVGTWKLTLGAERPLAQVLRQPGAGLIITGPNDVLMSGPMVKAEFAATQEDPGGSITFEGVSDSICLADALAYPDPTNANGASQTKAHDVRQGKAEDVMHSFVMANIGPTAPAERRKTHLVDGVSGGRGPAVIKSARFPVLGNLLTELALLGNLGFRVVQSGSSLVFETFEITDRTALIRLDVANGSLAGQRVAISPPGVTRAIVAGQGELTKRQFLQVQTPQSVEAEADWGRRIEQFIDQRNTDKWDELQQAGDEAMEDAGFTAVNVQVVPMEDGAMRFGHDWHLGDKVCVIVEDQELVSNATGMVLRANAEGFRVGVLLGDPTGFSVGAALSKRVTTTEARVSQLERSSDVGAAGDNQLLSIMGVY
ncbi:siphovirus ReqiPepy6 Gp37-like family protein [Streptomyces sp. ID05-39B]|uniref:siphovirus ReqiPepy6 Gp37-like family protein n=1 Tax=Streptomyces sp. ID05-39B TaxID=3028664 RepID=UPI0029AC57E8|nr:siphovirus ReqiPepy6 Gp37-like family protein [Streptomyces sp. ID05-39B]MDX3525071.1 siphovirus ReqiPepy6 Gp37-like family protein [Streptomyces sp. ID05-39B]